MEDVQGEESHKKPCARCKKLVPIEGFHRDVHNSDGRKYICKSCSRADGQARYKKRKAEAKKKGVCIRYGCTHKVHEKSNLCPEHFYQSVSQNTLKDMGFWKELKDLAEKQGYICPLTGDTLEAGVNMSLDHIKPVSRFPELKTKLTNLQWITKWANTAKMNLNLEDFVANCLKVANTCRNKDRK